MAYYAEFSISRIGESTLSPTDRAILLSEVRDYLVEKVQDSDSRADVESDVADDRAHAKIDAERRLNDKLWRLSVRLYSNDDQLRAEVFFGVALEDEISSSSAPMFMRDLVERYDCRVGPHRLGAAAPEEDDLETLLFNPERKLPVLMVSRDNSGDLPYGGIERLSEQLLGMAQVVEAAARGRYRREWGYQFDVRNGAARIIWPDARPHFLGGGRGGFYMPGRTDFTSDVVNDLYENSSPESFDREFVAVYVACMRFRNEQLRSHVEIDEPRELKRLRRSVRKAEREQGRLERSLATEQAERIRAENLRDTALRDVERLGEELGRVSKSDEIARAREEARDLRHEKDELAGRLAKREDTIRRLNNQLQDYRQKERAARNGRNGFDSLIGDPSENPGQLSLVGHGLNIMRDPVRKFIIERLTLKYRGAMGVRSALDRLSVVMERATNLESVLDFGNFSHVVSSHPECFGANAYTLSDKLRKIQSARNRTIHPDFKENTATQRSAALLTDISTVLNMVGASEESQRVRELKSAL